MITVTVVQHDKELCGTWKNYISSQNGFYCISVYSTCKGALEHITYDHPDVILMGVTFNGKKSGIDTIRRVKRILPSVNIIMVTTSVDGNAVFESFRAGAVGYFDKTVTCDELLAAIRAVHNGGSPMNAFIARTVIDYFKELDGANSLSSRQCQVLQELCAGKNFIQIADKLDISISTVNFHIQNIYKNLRAHNAAHAGYIAGKDGLV